MLVAIWFSDNKQKMTSQSINERKTLIDKRKQLIADIGYLSLRMKHSMQPSFIEKYKKLAEYLKP